MQKQEDQKLDKRRDKSHYKVTKCILHFYNLIRDLTTRHGRVYALPSLTQHNIPLYSNHQHARYS